MIKGVRASSLDREIIRNMSIKAVIFDLGGVVFDSPMDVFARYEARLGLPDNFLNHHIVKAGHDGAWSRMERGELKLEEFFEVFDAELAAAGVRISSAELMAEVAEAGGVRPVMLEAIRRLRTLGFKVAALTNNWAHADEGSAPMNEFKAEFDVFVESSKVGLSKPDPKIYELACFELDLPPHEAVFLDDIGRNLKTARLLGMATIKVADPDQALSDLEGLLGVTLR